MDVCDDELLFTQARCLAVHLCGDSLVWAPRDRDLPIAPNKSSITDVLLPLHLYDLQKGELAIEGTAALRAKIFCMAAQLEAADQTTPRQHVTIR